MRDVINFIRIVNETDMSEFCCGYALTEELVQDLALAFLRAVFPSLYREGKKAVLGCPIEDRWHSGLLTIQIVPLFKNRKLKRT